jgi:putative transcriptional regulator
MATVRRTLAEVGSAHPKFTPDERAELLARSDADLERAALADPDNLPLSHQDLSRMATARAVRATREATGLSQNRFAECYRINPARLRDWEQGRFEPDSVALAYLNVIRHAPGTVNRALGLREGSAEVVEARGARTAAGSKAPASPVKERAANRGKRAGGSKGRRPGG